MAPIPAEIVHIAHRQACPECGQRCAALVATGEEIACLCHRCKHRWTPPDLAAAVEALLRKS